MVTARRHYPTAGNITPRRLNRREYSNSIEQLTGVKVDVGSLPIDGGSGLRYCRVIAVYLQRSVRAVPQTGTSGNR